MDQMRQEIDEQLKASRQQLDIMKSNIERLERHVDSITTKSDTEGVPECEICGCEIVDMSKSIFDEKTTSTVATIVYWR